MLNSRWKDTADQLGKQRSDDSCIRQIDLYNLFSHDQHPPNIRPHNNRKVSPCYKKFLFSAAQM